MSNYILYGDGINDDTDAIQELIDSGSCEVALPPPKSIILYRNRWSFHQILS